MKNLQNENLINRKMLEKKKKSIEDIIKKLKTYSSVTQLINQSILYFKDDDFIEKLDCNPNIICFGNYLFDLKDCKWRESLPCDMCSLKCGVAKDEVNNKDFHLIDEILSDIFINNEVKNFVINEMSLFLNGNNLRQLFYIWLGTGANGKSFLAKCLENSFGDYYTELPTESITGKEAKTTQATPFLANGKGRRIVVYSEPEEGSKLNNSIMKKLTGGESVLYRELYGDPRKYKPMFKPIILCNTNFELQQIRDKSIPRRLRYINFKTKFVDNPILDFQRKRNEDYMSEEFLNKIKGSFMWLLINNYVKLKETNFKFNMPQIIINDQSEFIDNNDDIKIFLNEYYETTDNNKEYISCKNLFEHYKTYCKQKGEQTKIREKVFKELVIEVYPYKDVYRYTDENGEKRKKRSIFTNIKLREEEED